jgi:hypothetical protein
MNSLFLPTSQYNTSKILNTAAAYSSKMTKYLFLLVDLHNHFEPLHTLFPVKVSFAKNQTPELEQSSQPRDLLLWYIMVYPEAKAPSILYYF